MQFIEMVDHSKAVLNSPFGRMKHLLVLMLLLFFIPFNTHAKGKGKAKIKLRTNPNQIEDVWTVSNELNYYHEPNQPYQNTLYENITLDYSASNGWDFQLASYNIPLVGGGAQNYQADTYFNISKTFIISQDFQAVLGTQSGTTLLHSANSRQLHNADYALVVYQPSRQVNLHAGSPSKTTARSGFCEILRSTSCTIFLICICLLIFFPKSISATSLHFCKSAQVNN